MQSGRIGVLLVNRPRPFANWRRGRRLRCFAQKLATQCAAESVRQRRALVTNIRDRNDLPEGYRALRRDIYSDAQRVKACESSIEKAAHGRIRDPQRHATDLPTIDNPVCFHQFDRKLAASSIADDRARCARLDRDQLGGEHRQSARRDRIIDTRFDFRAIRCR